MGGAGGLICERRSVALASAFGNARASWRERTLLVAHLLDSDGHHGRGEASPLPGYCRDDLDACQQALQGLSASALRRATQISRVDELLAEVAALLPEALPAARFALETALLDRLGQRQRRPMWQLLREALDGQLGHAEPVALSAVLAPGARLMAEARQLHRDGVRNFKLKIGPGGLTVEQQETLRAVRETYGIELTLRFDANRSLDPARLSETFAELASWQPEYVEEPVAGAERQDWSWSPCALALDESLQTLPNECVDALLASPAWRAVVLKPTALSLGRCLDLARKARRQRRSVSVSHVLEGHVGWAACAHLALALAPSGAAGLWPLPHQATARAVCSEGQLRPMLAPGLGLEQT